MVTKALSTRLQVKELRSRLAQSQAEARSAPQGPSPDEVAKMQAR